MKKIQYPTKEPILVIRTCTKAICCQNGPATKLLSVLLYWYDHSEGEIENGQYIVYRSQEQLVTDACNEITVKTLHDVAAPVLQLLGYVEPILTSNGKVYYAVNVNVVMAALEAYKNKKLDAFIDQSLQDKLEKFLIVIPPQELEKFPNVLEKFLFILEKFLIVIRNFSNSQRGRKASTEAGGRAKSQNTESKRDYNEIVESSANAPNNTPPQEKSERPNPSNQSNDGVLLASSTPTKVEVRLDTPEQEMFWKLWCNLEFNELRPNLTITAKKHVKQLAPLIKTMEEMASLADKARRDLEANENAKSKTVYLGNCVSSYPGWKQEQAPKPKSNSSGLNRPQQKPLPRDEQFVLKQLSAGKDIPPALHDLIPKVKSYMETNNIVCNAS